MTFQTHPLIRNLSVNMQLKNQGLFKRKKEIKSINKKALSLDWVREGQTLEFILKTLAKAWIQAMINLSKFKTRMLLLMDPKTWNRNDKSSNHATRINQFPSKNSKSKLSNCRTTLNKSLNPNHLKCLTLKRKSVEKERKDPPKLYLERKKLILRVPPTEDLKKFLDRFLLTSRNHKDKPLKPRTMIKPLIMENNTKTWLLLRWKCSLNSRDQAIQVMIADLLQPSFNNMKASLHSSQKKIDH